MVLSVGAKDWVDDYVTHLELSRTQGELDRLEARLDLATGAALNDVLLGCMAGKPWKVVAGGRTFEGDLLRVEARRVGAGAEVLLFGLAKLHRARHVRVAQAVEDTRDKIVGTLAKKAGITLKAQAVGAEKEGVVLLGEPVFAALDAMAAERNFVYAAEGTSLVFRPAGLAGTGSAIEIDWDEDLLDYSWRMDIQDAANTVEFHGYDVLKGEVPAPGKAAAPADLAKISGGKSGPELWKAAGLGEVVLQESAQLRAALPGELKELAQGELRRRAERFIEGEVRVPGFVDADPGRKLTLAGAPEALAGPFLVRGVTWALRHDEVRTTLQFFSDTLPKGVG